MQRAISHPIIVGVALRDDDSAPLALARDLARLTGAPLALVHAHADEPVLPVPDPAFEAALRRRTRAHLERVAETLRDELAVTVHVGAGSSAAAVLHDAAHAFDASLVVVGSTHRGRVGRAVPGSVTARLLHGAPTAVAMAPRRHTGGHPIRRIGVAFTDAPEGRDALAAGALLASLCGGTLSVLVVHQPIPVGSALAVPGWVTPAAAELRAAEQARAAADAACDLLPLDVPADVEVIRGHRADVLTAASAKLDLLVCGSRGYGPLHAVMLGGVSRALVDTAACPVLVLPRAASRTVEKLAPRSAAAYR